mmetsp:Transcript_35684/g.54611  ORF Transcript_35684/g.54611 Transcript_35684/m.54611 type:complete len:230 (+) Transcript_35684:329-1018(+)|eukprot:CAMPEP_0170503556 /NCGR_PEP_ID=MMETSP0208-20121228/45167_1 /TAXON_ID=197538 /ORGANISM="Strombidium inclinatum, Strain S3" /LENGTH=229 /DNA_ID=CAMNT_0010783273 /DNA_START=480 /DNA_END=1169 /DNA_ORIENTATION=+
MVMDDLEVKIIDFGLARTLSSSHQAHEKPPVPKLRVEKKELGDKLLSQKQARKQAKRSLSPHVYSRIYRPPEICLLEKHYSFEADIWSIGCIIAEILLSQEIYSLNSDYSYERYLFKATSCYPLSPVSELKDKEDLLDRIENLDLVKVILSILGDQRGYDLSYISSHQLHKYVIANFPSENRIRFHREFKGSDRELLEVLKLSLQFNPYFRPSAADLWNRLNKPWENRK